jgi:signal transduction histidine kinase
VSHELRTPLTPIIGFATMLASGRMADEEVREVGGTILEQANRQLRIVEIIELFASLDAGRDVLHLERVNIGPLLHDVVDARAATTNHNITCRVRRRTPDVLADVHWLSRAVDELVDNAIKFSPAGGSIHVTAEAGDDDGRRVVLVAVADRGIGMLPEQVKNAFDEFTQGDESNTRAFGGLGLGLPLARRLSEQAGGRVTFETEVGKGSKFTILLPVVPRSESH